MLHSISRWPNPLVSLLAVTVTLLALKPVAAQGVLAEPRVAIEGPEGQLLVMTVGYFYAGELVKTVTSRVEIGGDDDDWQQLEFGHNGIQVVVAVPTSIPLTVKLLDGEQELVSRESVGIGNCEVRQGMVPQDSVLELPRVLLNESEQAFARKFLTGLSSSDTESLVSKMPASNIDFQTLNAYCQSLHRFLGPIRNAEPKNDLDGWLSWDGSLGVRVLSGNVKFENGECRFALMVADDQLVDAVPKAKNMPEVWFAGPSSEEEYIAEAVRLAELLFAGEIPAARALFSRRYHDSITPQSLQELHRTLLERFGSKVLNAELKKTELLPYDEETRTRVLEITHALTLPSGKRCLSQVEVVFPCGPDIISRGNLASINIREAWQSAEPEIADGGFAGLRALADGEASEFASLLHPQAKLLFNAGTLFGNERPWVPSLGAMPEPPDWDRWVGQAQGANANIQGVLDGPLGKVSLRLDFADKQIVGATLLGAQSGFSSLDSIAQNYRDAAREQGLSFWTSLFENDLDTAHSKLAPIFQERLPLADLRKMIEGSGFQQMAKLVAIEPANVRISNRLDRPLPVLVVAYFIASLENGTRQPLRCEFSLPESDAAAQLELVTFDSSFEAEFPTQDAAKKLDALASALASGSSQQVIGLLAEANRSFVDPVILDGFLKQLGLVAGDFRLAEPVQVVHEYRPGNRKERYAGKLLGTKGEVPITAVFKFGQLLSFECTSDDLINFIGQVEGVDCFERVAVEFVKQWIEGEIDEAQGRMISELRTDEIATKLRSWKEDLLRLTNGSTLSQVDVKQIEVSETDNSVTLAIELEMESEESAAIEVVLSVDAFSASIAGLSLK